MLHNAYDSNSMEKQTIYDGNLFPNISRLAALKTLLEKFANKFFRDQHLP